MKKTTIFASALALSLALLQPIPALAGDKDKKDKEDKGKEKAPGGGGKAGNRGQAVQQPHSAAPGGHSKGGVARSANVNDTPGNAPAGHSRDARSVPARSSAAPNAGVNTKKSGFAPSTPLVSQRSGFSASDRNVRPNSAQRLYTRENNYGGLWVLGDNHSDWDRNGVHVWNRHRYAWYDGGWLILDGGFRPRGFSYPNNSANSTVAQVQRKLSAEGYALGRADGVIGPATRDAISDYQQDNGLAVTGRINAPLLTSLGLE